MKGASLRPGQGYTGLLEEMKIGLHDAEKEHFKHKIFPNLALMKISAYHKEPGLRLRQEDSSFYPAVCGGGNRTFRVAFRHICAGAGWRGLFAGCADYGHLSSQSLLYVLQCAVRLAGARGDGESGILYEKRSR